jgi:hypothetical protein
MSEPPVGTLSRDETWKDAQGRRRTRLYGLVIFVAGLLTQLPALLSRYLLDDFLHASMVRGTFPVHRAPYDLYDFVGDADRTALFAHGMLPWWTDPALKIRFFRPLSSLILWSERRVIGDVPILLHLLSFGWWCAAVLGAHALFRRALEARPALVATAIFALSPCHTLPLAWLANREALMSLTFAVFALGALARFLEQGKAREVVLATVLFALACASGEYALGAGGYVVSMALLFRGPPRGRRALALATFAVPAAIYLGIRARLGYGTAASGFYTDPLSDPVAYVAQAPHRIVLLLLDGWLSLDGETLTGETPIWFVTAIFGVGTALVVRSLRRVLRESPDARKGATLAYFVGSILCLGPVLAVVPSPRVLGFAILGVAPVVALLLERAWFSREAEGREPHDPLGGLVALGLAFSAFVHAPVTAFLVGRHFGKSSVAFEKAALELGTRMGDTASADVLVMRGVGGSFFLPFALRDDYRPPKRWRVLAETGHVLALRRGPRTLDLVATSDQGIYPSEPGNLFRTDRYVLPVGSVVTLPGLRVTVLEMGKAGPRSARFEIDGDLESFDWVAERKSGFVEAPPPAVGFGKPFEP